MIKRPSPGDTEEDIIQMQADFLQEKYKDRNFEPAAKVVRQNPTTARKLSKFAEKRAQEKLEKGTAGISESVDEPKAQTTAYKPIIGEIKERRSETTFRTSERNAEDSVQGFPKPMRLNRSELQETSGMSLFAMSRAKNHQPSTSAQPMDTAESAAPRCVVRDFGDKSFILSGDSSGAEIHKENVQRLSQMNERDLQDQRRQLMESLDPSLIKFLRSKRTAPVSPVIPEEPLRLDADAEMASVENASTLDILHDPNYESWPNFDIVEPAKLQWMRDVSQKLPRLKPGETYEARFDWKGVLLPYAAAANDAQTSPVDERELYLHGDDAQRAGYTLQELFRLARSKVVQQRIAALTSIAGLLSIHQQGFYDTVLDVPVSKIFFLLRFAFDDNHVAAILEVTARALAALFHNDADEVLLDFMRDCSSNFHEPVLSVDSTPVNALKTAENEDELEAKFAQIELEKRATKFGTDVDGNDDEASRDTLNDFHLAEIDLIDCFLRTNVVQRINYILFTMRPPNSTVGNCLKLLIRLARSGSAVVQTLFDNDLLANCIAAYLSDAHSVTANYYGMAQHLALKLVRIVASYGRHWCARLVGMEIVDVLKKLIFVHNEVTVGSIKLQIEAFRLAKVLIISDLRGSLYDELTPALLYMLEWSYQFVQFERPAHLLFRQHATALVTLIGSTGPTQCSDRFTEKLQLCCSKWFHQATQHGVPELSQNILLAACLNACARLSGDGFHEFYAKYLCGWMRSQHFAAMCADLSKQSPLLRNIAQRTNQNAALPHLQSVVVGTASQLPEFLVTQKYSVCLLTSVLNVLHTLHLGQHRKLFTDILVLFWTPDIANYVERLATQPLNEALRRNWFVRSETNFIVDLLKCAELRDHRLDKRTLQAIAYKVSTYLTEDQVAHVVFLFDCVLFECALYAESIGQTPFVMLLWKRIYQHICFEGVRPIEADGLMVLNHGRLVLAAEWPYQPVLNVLRSVTEQAGKGAPSLHERDLLRACLTFTSLQKINDLEYLSPTEELIFLMICFLGPAATFLEADINAMLCERVRVFFNGNQMTIFKLNEPHNGAITFENLYLLFVDHFEGTSYGDNTFGALLMVPLSQKYNLQWRRLVWSEHVSAMRFIQCTEQQLIGSLDDYLYPVETDVAMLKYYHQAVHSVPFAEHSLPRRIAEHHLRLSREMKLKADAAEAT